MKKIRYKKKRALRLGMELLIIMSLRLIKIIQ